MQIERTQQRIILASQSPRRRQLLENAGLQVEVVPSQFDEKQVALCAAPAYVAKLAAAKSSEVAGQHPSAWVIAADTIVLIGDQILNKPTSPSDARQMLIRLSGSTHEVLTGIDIVGPRQRFHHTQVVRTEVDFKRLTDAEIDWYIGSGEPFDKAGAYAIQGMGTFLVRGIRGSYTNVVGLPVCEVIEQLIAAGAVHLGPAAEEG
ncbi:MAG: Maf family protein [Desulfosarcinaceae bacterium]|nr:Maf family protein [Desulfosarcinaceae bacterium]